MLDQKSQKILANLNLKPLSTINKFELLLIRAILNNNHETINHEINLLKGKGANLNNNLVEYKSADGTTIQFNTEDFIAYLDLNKVNNYTHLLPILKSLGAKHNPNTDSFFETFIKTHNLTGVEGFEKEIGIIKEVTAPVTENKVEETVTQTANTVKEETTQKVTAPVAENKVEETVTQTANTVTVQPTELAIVHNAENISKSVDELLNQAKVQTEGVNNNNPDVIDVVIHTIDANEEHRNNNESDHI